MNNKNIVRLSVSSLSLLLLSSCAQLNKPALCDADMTPIPHIQGSGAVSPLLDQTLTTRGIVTANWHRADQLGGYFIQSAKADDDNNTATSNGLFIAEQNATVKVGDVVYLTGVVQELNGVTQLQNITASAVCASAQPIEATPFTLPVAATEAFEAVEGMLLSLTQSLTVNGHYQLQRHGQFDVAPMRLYTPTQHHKPGAEAQAQAHANSLARLVIDDNLAPNPAQISVPQPALTAENSLRSGDVIAPVIGVLNEFKGSYRLQPTSAVTVVEANQRPAAPAAPATNAVRVAAFNVLNYFNGNGAEKTFPTERGAKTAADFKRQHDKIIAALSQLNADIIGLMEIENDGYDKHSAIYQLTTALAEHTGQPWRFVRAGVNNFGDDSITNGLIYRSDKVSPQGQPLTITEAPFGTRSRLPLIQRFAPMNTVENLVVAVNHFKSKGSCPRDAANPNANQQDGQGCWNAVRTESAKRLAAFLNAHPDLKRHGLRVLMGDFNAYAQEDPIQALLAAGYYNRIDAFNPQAYSYVYDAQAGSLDHLLVSSPLTGRVVNQAKWSINADEPTLLQYDRATNNPQWYAPSPYRSSDHDPVYADIQF
ncbi:MAG: ExeM/NucH family extracellular endonuclease [Gammaproteobacteria bacterium]|nr:ExeM/NucH family extracellular endonuclease [Gammaproteobacteria bacterium]